MILRGEGDELQTGSTNHFLPFQKAQSFWATNRRYQSVLPSPSRSVFAIPAAPRILQQPNPIVHSKRDAPIGALANLQDHMMPTTLHTPQGRFLEPLLRSTRNDPYDTVSKAEDDAPGASEKGRLVALFFLSLQNARLFWAKHRSPSGVPSVFHFVRYLQQPTFVKHSIRSS